MLVEYGIQTEKSDVRAHVSVVNKTIYVFKTQCALDAINTYSPEVRQATQPGVGYATGEGWIVGVDLIKDMVRVANPSFKWECFKTSLSTSEKGSLAMKCVQELISAGRFPTFGMGVECEEVADQIAGKDIILTANTRIQVKCDYRAGDRPLGTGNLFLQKAECNPRKLV